MIVNLRGLREAGIFFMVPTYLFVGTLLVAIAIGLVKTVLAAGHPMPAVALPPHPAPALAAASTWILLQAFANGCTAMTGVEAVSNGVRAFREPTVRERAEDAYSNHRPADRDARGYRVSGPRLRHHGDDSGKTRLPERPLDAGGGGRGARLVLLRDRRIGAGHSVALGEHRLRRFPAPLQDGRAE